MAAPVASIGCPVHRLRVITYADDPNSAPLPGLFQQTYDMLALGAVASGGVLTVAVSESLALIAENTAVTRFTYLTPSLTGFVYFSLFSSWWWANPRPWFWQQ